MVLVDVKVSMLLAKWVRRLDVCPNGWVYLLTYWLLDRFGITIPLALSVSTNFDWESLPPLYCALFKAWTFLGGTWSATKGYRFGSSSLGGPFPISKATCKSCYVTLEQANTAQPYCVVKFGLFYGPLDWGLVLSSFFLIPLDRRVSDLAWKVAHGVLYTAKRLHGFGYGLSPLCFSGFPLESLKHLFIFCPMAQSGLTWIQSLLSIAAPRAPCMEVKQVLFAFSRDDLRTLTFVDVYLVGNGVIGETINGAFHFKLPCYCLFSSLLRLYLFIFSEAGFG